MRLAVEKGDPVLDACFIAKSGRFEDPDGVLAKYLEVRTRHCQPGNVNFAVALCIPGYAEQAIDFNPTDDVINTYWRALFFSPAIGRDEDTTGVKSKLDILGRRCFLGGRYDAAGHALEIGLAGAPYAEDDLARLVRWGR